MGTSEVEAGLERLLAGTATEDDRSAVRSALLAGVLVTGDRAVAIGGNASDVIIASGDGNVVLSFKGTDAATIQAALNSIIPTRLREIPSPPRDFTGREEELKELMIAILQGGITISGLQGLGGIGKTALALKLVEQLSPSYPDAQLYLDLKGASPQPLSAAAAMTHVIHAYHPAAKLPDIEAEFRGLYQSVLRGQRALLLMDNAASAEQVEQLIPPASCLLLVTSRQHFTLPGLLAKNLDTLLPADACKLLLTITPRIGDDAEKIAKLCGYLPLALRLAGSALVNFVNLSAEDYARRLNDSKQRLQLIDASLSLSYQLLSELLKKRWRQLAVFPDTFDDEAVAAMWGLAVDKAQDALGELITSSLLEWNEGTRRYRLHDLARLFANSRLTWAERGAAQRSHAAQYQTVLAAADSLYLEGGEAITRGLALFDLEWGNILAGQAWASKEGKTDSTAARLCIAYPDAGAYLLTLRQHPHQRIKWLEASLTAARHLKEKVSEGNALSNLGNAYSDLDETRSAIDFYDQHLSIAREIGDRRGEGNALGNLGNAYDNLGQPKRAVDFYEQRLVIAREIGDQRNEGNALGNLGGAYAKLGEIRRAIEFYQQRLGIAREIGDRMGEANTLGNLGLAYADLGEIQRAIECHEQHLTITREIGDRRGEGKALGNLGIAYKDLGQNRQAIEFLEQRLDIARETGDRRGEGNAMLNMGNAYASLGETRMAMRFYEQALLITREIGDRRGEGNALTNLGVSYAESGEIKPAIEFFQQALLVATETDNAKTQGRVLLNISLLLDQLGDRAQAIVCAGRALEIYEQIEDPSSVKVREQLTIWRQKTSQQ